VSTGDSSITSAAKIVAYELPAAEATIARARCPRSSTRWPACSPTASAPAAKKQPGSPWKPSPGQPSR
jgi:hypothetical protein